jgi:hypothetical protein
MRSSRHPRRALVTAAVVVSIDHDHMLRPLPGARLTLDPHESYLRPSVVGGPRMWSA